MWFLDLTKRWIHNQNTFTCCEPAPGNAGFAVRKSDIEKGVLHDITTPQGFLLALKGVLRLKHNALLWLGVPCSRILSSISLVDFDRSPDCLGLNDSCFFRGSHESSSSKLGMDQFFHNQKNFGSRHHGWWTHPICNGGQHHCCPYGPSMHAGGYTGCLLVWTLAYDSSWC